jgi:hypothetical protein
MSQGTTGGMAALLVSWPPAPYTNNTTLIDYNTNQIRPRSAYACPQGESFTTTGTFANCCDGSSFCYFVIGCADSIVTYPDSYPDTTVPWY